MPAANPGFLVGFHQGHGRAGKDNASLFDEVDLVLDPGTPISNELSFVKEQVLDPIDTRLTLAPGFQDGFNTAKLQYWMIEGRVKDISRCNTLLY